MLLSFNMNSMLEFHFLSVILKEIFRHCFTVINHDLLLSTYLLNIECSDDDDVHFHFMTTECSWTRRMKICKGKCHVPYILSVVNPGQWCLLKRQSPHIRRRLHDIVSVASFIREDGSLPDKQDDFLTFLLPSVSSEEE